MATYTVYPTHDGHVQSQSSNYTTARTGNNLSYAQTTTTADVGQWYGGSNSYYVVEYFQTYTLSALGLSGVYCTSATLNFYVQTDYSATDFTWNARLKTYSDTSFGTSQWVAGADLSSNTLLASITTSDTFTGGKTMTSQAALATNVTNNLAGKLQVLYSSSRTEAANQPNGDEDLLIRTADYSGTTYDPYLYFETAPTSTKTASITANAAIKKTQSSSFTANSYILRSGFYANAHIKRIGYARAFTADSYLTASSTSKTVTPDNTNGVAVAKALRTSAGSVVATKLYRYIGSEYVLLHEDDANFIWTDPAVPLNTLSTYRFEDINGSGSVIATSDVLATVTLDDWALSWEGTSITVTPTGLDSGRIIQREEFTTLDQVYKEVQTGLLLGLTGSLTTIVSYSDRDDLVRKIREAADASTTVYLKSPWGSVWPVALGAIGVKYLARGNASITVMFTQHSEA